MLKVVPGAGDAVPPHPSVILDAATRLFAQRGYRQTGLDDIAGAVGIARGTLHQHFTTTEDVLVAIVEPEVALLARRYPEIVGAGQGARETLRTMIEFGFTETLRHADLMSILIHEQAAMAACPRFRDIRARLRAVQDLWSGVLEDGVRQGVFRPGLDTRLSLRMILNMARSAVAWYRPDNPRYPVEEIVATQADLILGGLC